MSSIVLFIIITFLAGIYFCAKPKNNEAFSLHKSHDKVNPKEVRCPNMLIQKGSKIYLYDSKIAKVPGVNPVEFDNLEDYVKFLDWQHSEGIRCPVLFLQQTYDAQGQEIYKARPNILNPQGGIPPIAATSISKATDPSPSPPGYSDRTLLVDASHDDKPYNKGNYPGFDATPYYIGMQTPLDQMNVDVKNAPISPDPMDDNWGGAGYTQSLVDKGYYKGNEVSLYVP
jgi:hypothetical protein